MTWVLIIFTILNMVLAFIDSRIIATKHKVLHGLNGLVYLALVAGAVWYTGNYWMIGALLFCRLVVFNIALSLFRGLAWNYISPCPKAWMDKIAKAVFGNRGTLMYFVYLLIFITFTILSYANFKLWL